VCMCVYDLLRIKVGLISSKEPYECETHTHTHTHTHTRVQVARDDVSGAVDDEGLFAA
jgi:hypothetical protein